MKDKIKASVDIEIPDRVLFEIRERILHGEFISDKVLLKHMLNRIYNNIQDDPEFISFGKVVKDEVIKKIALQVSANNGKLWDHIGTLYERIEMLEKKEAIK